MRWAILISLAVAAGGCLTAPERGTPLYAAGTAALPPSQVATLEVWVQNPSVRGATRTFIEAVDGREVVTLASPFELLPGCHVVETAFRQTTTSKGTTVALRGDTGPHIFPFRMRAGHAYTVVEKWSEPFGPFATVSVRAFERASVGGAAEEVEPSAGEADVQACRGWTPPTS